MTCPWYGSASAAEVGPLFVQDQFVSVYDVEWYRDNITANYECLFHIHGADAPATISTPAWLLRGHHEEPEIARLVVIVENGLLAGTTPTVTATLMNTALRGVSRMSTGEYFLAVPALAAWSYGQVAPIATNATPTRIARAVFVTSPSTGLVVSTFELTGGDFVRADYSFAIPIWEVP